MHDSDSAINESVYAYFRKVVVAIRLLIVLRLTVGFRKTWEIWIVHKPSAIWYWAPSWTLCWTLCPGGHHTHSPYCLSNPGWWWLEHDGLFSHSVGECHHPNWRTHIFQRGRSTTNQNLYFFLCSLCQCELLEKECFFSYMDVLRDQIPTYLSRRDRIDTILRNKRLSLGGADWWVIPRTHTSHRAR